MTPLVLAGPLRAVCFDWGGTLMSEAGPEDRPMGLWPSVEAVDGAAACLAALADGPWRLCVATNASVSTPALVVRALARVGLMTHLREVFCFTDVGHRKDELAFWDVVSARLGVPLPAIAMVGDSLEQDCLAPRRFGVQGVWFNPRGLPVPRGVAAPQVRSLGEFARAVRGTEAVA